MQQQIRKSKTNACSLIFQYIQLLFGFVSALWRKGHEVELSGTIDDAAQETDMPRAQPICVLQTWPQQAVHNNVANIILTTRPYLTYLLTSSYCRNMHCFSTVALRRVRSVNAFLAGELNIVSLTLYQGD